MVKWLWAIKHSDDLDYWFWHNFETEESIAKKFPQAARLKLVWSETQFP